MTDPRPSQRRFRCQCRACCDARDAAVDALVEAARNAIEILDRNGIGGVHVEGFRIALVPFGGER